MKKNLLATLVLASAVMTASAQAVKGDVVSTLSKVNATSFARTSQMMEKKSSENVGKALMMNSFKAPAAKKADAVSDLEALYSIPYGAWIEGIEPGAGWYSVPFIYTPGLVDQKWLNYSGSSDETTPIESKWADMGDYAKYEVDEKGHGTAKMFGVAPSPTLTVTQGDATATYNIGQGGTNGYTLWYGGVGEYKNLGMAQVGVSGPYGGFTDLDLTTNTKGVGTEYFSSNIVGFAQLFHGMNDFVNAKSAIISLSVDDNASETPLNGKELTCKVYKINEDGSLGDVLITATATDENVTPLGTWLYSIEFPFQEKDPLFGVIDSPIYLDDDCDVLVTFTGFEEVEMPMSAVFCGSEGFILGGYVILEDGSMSSVTYRGTDYPQIDLMVTLTSIIPVLSPTEDMPEVLSIPVEGGFAVTQFDEENNAYNDYDLYTNATSIEDFIYYTDVEDETDEWVKVEYSDDFLEEYGVIAFFVGADALPEGVEGRSCTLTLDLNGKAYEIPVVQGAAAGVESVSVMKNASKHVFNIAGQRVNNATKGIFIQDGRKFVK